MLRLLRFTDSQPRWKKGQPAQSTTGVASANCSHGPQLALTQSFRGLPGTISPMVRISRGAERASPTQKRRVISSSSLVSCSAVTVSGSSAMPQMGQPVFEVSRTCGCIGQVQTVPE